MRDGRLGYPGPGTWTQVAVRERDRTALAGLTSLTILAVAVVFFAWEALHAAGYTYGTWAGLRISDYDEAAYVVSAQLLRQGYHLFQDVFSSQPALFLGSLWAGLKLFGTLVHDDTVASHLVIGLYGALAVAATASAAWASYGRSGAIGAAVAMALTPAMVLYGHTIEAEMPMIGTSMLAVAAAAWYYRTRHRGLLVAAGLLLGVGTEMKVLALIFLLPVGLFALAASFAHEGEMDSPATQFQAEGPRDNVPLNVLIDILLLALATVLPLIIILGLFSPRLQYDQVVTFHLKASEVNPLDVAANVRALRDMLLWDPGLLLAAALGVACGLLLHRPVSTTIYVLSLLATFVLLSQYHPLISHQFSVLFPPLAVLAGGAVGGLGVGRRYPLAAILGAVAVIAWGAAQIMPLPTARASTAPNAPTQSLSTWKRTTGLFLSVASAKGGPLAPFMTHIETNETKNTRACVAAANAANRALALTTTTYRTLLRQCLAGWTARHVRPWQKVVTDDLFIATAHNRLVPPQLDDPSIVRASAGYLTQHQLEANTWSTNAKAVVIWRGVFSDTRFFPDYVHWLRRHFKELYSGVPGARAFVRK